MKLVKWFVSFWAANCDFISEFKARLYLFSQTIDELIGIRKKNDFNLCIKHKEPAMKFMCIEKAARGDHSAGGFSNHKKGHRTGGFLSSQIHFKMKL